MQLRALLEVLAPFALAVGVWIWSTMVRGSRRLSRRKWAAPQQPHGEGIPLLYSMESDPRPELDQK